MLKYAIRHYSRRPLSNLLLILQMIVIHVICIALISSVASRYDEYAPFRSVMRGEGNYYNIMNAFDPDTGDVYSAEQLAQKLNGNCRISCVYDHYDVYWHTKDAWDSELFRVLTLDDDILRDYCPPLSAGEWISVSRDYGGCVPVVITPNKMGYTLGTKLQYRIGEDERTAVVVGILQDYGRVPIPVPVEDDGELSVHQFYTTYSAAVEGQPLLISAESLFTPTYSQQNGMMFVQYPDGISAEDQAENHAFLLRYGSVFQNAELPMLRHNTWRYIFAQFLTLLPVAAAVLILAVTSILSMSALAAKRQLRDYAVYALCGLPWKRCLRIHAAEMMLSNATAFVLTWVGMFVCKPLYENTVLRIGISQILSGVVVMLFCLVTALILPRQLFHRNSLKTVLQNEE